MTKTTIKLPERFDINEVEQIQLRLQTALEKDADIIEVNLVAIRMIDSAGMQLLMSFANEALAQDKEVKLVKVSEEFQYASKLLGVKDVIDGLV